MEDVPPGGGRPAGRRRRPGGDQGRPDREADRNGQAVQGDGAAARGGRFGGGAGGHLGDDSLGGRQHLQPCNVAVSNEVPGTVSKIRFESGQIAKEGQVLVELDAEVERAQLASVDARRDLAGRNAERSRKLAAGNVISKAQLDDVEAQLKTATTDTAALRAQVDRKVIRAPFRGRLGIRAVNVGQYLTPGTTVTTLDAMGGTFADFTLPQEELSRVAVGLPVRVTMEGKKEPLTGTISAIDPTVDLATRNVKIRA